MIACPHPEKRSYETRAAAAAPARALRRHGSSVDLKPYRCVCTAWHVGHSQASLSFRIREARRKGIA